MASPSRLILLVIVIYLTGPSFSSRPIFGSKVTSEIVTDICNHTTDPSVCLEALKSDPRVASADLTGLCQISIDLARANATNSFALVKKLLAEVNKTAMINSGPDVKKYLLTCYNVYGGMASNVDDCSDDLKNNNIASLIARAIGVLSDVHSCDNLDGLASIKKNGININQYGPPAPIPVELHKANAIMYDLVSLTVVVAERLLQK